ncbi:MULTISPECIES: hypothetical protein [unclassified Pseudonocardia]|uniref:hypothetical protein n=1 Tax=unclassified Pseudonocardia TaxID=2619320 RepID=UPI00158CA4EA|nr:MULTISPECIES: hypothetical protein [unclassified Pseudonocardia]
MIGVSGAQQQPAVWGVAWDWKIQYEVQWVKKSKIKRRVGGKRKVMCGVDVVRGGVVVV